MFLENLSPKYLLALINQYYVLHSGFETPHYILHFEELLSQIGNF